MILKSERLTARSQLPLASDSRLFQPGQILVALRTGIKTIATSSSTQIPRLPTSQHGPTPKYIK